MKADRVTRAGARWLVTGARGQLGASLVALLARHDIEVVEIGHVHAASEVEAMLAGARPDALINCAAVTHVDECETRKDAHEVNGLWPGRFALACRERGCLMVQLSTDYVFDGTASRPIAEDAPPAPLNAYGKSKLEGERQVRHAGGEYLVVRTQWLFGAGRNFVRTICTAARDGRALRVVDDQIGRPTATDALASALFEALVRGARDTLHLACEGIASWYDLACAVVEAGAARGLCPPAAVTPVPTREMPRPAARPAYSVLALERARALGVSLPHWRDALARYLDAEREAQHV